MITYGNTAKWQYNAMPKIISARPLIVFSAFGLGKYGGIILNTI
jgi:hypothetical protein